MVSVPAALIVAALLLIAGLLVKILNLRYEIRKMTKEREDFLALGGRELLDRMNFPDKVRHLVEKLRQIFPELMRGDWEYRIPELLQQAACLKKWVARRFPEEVKAYLSELEGLSRQHHLDYALSGIDYLRRALSEALQK